MERWVGGLTLISFLLGLALHLTLVGEQTGGLTRAGKQERYSALDRILPSHGSKVPPSVCAHGPGPSVVCLECGDEQLEQGVKYRLWTGAWSRIGEEGSKRMEGETFQVRHAIFISCGRVHTTVHMLR